MIKLILAVANHRLHSELPAIKLKGLLKEHVTQQTNFVTSFTK